MPAHHRLRPNHNHGRSPITQPSQPRQAHPRRGIDASRLYPTLPKERQLSAKNQVFRLDGSSRSDGENEQADQIGEQTQNHANEGNHAVIMPDFQGCTQPLSTIAFLRRTTYCAHLCRPQAAFSTDHAGLLEAGVLAASGSGIAIGPARAPYWRDLSLLGPRPAVWL